MADLLTAVGSISLQEKPELQKTERSPPVQQGVTASQHAISKPEDALEILRAQPDRDSLRQVLLYLNPNQRQKTPVHEFHISKPSPIAAKVINEIVNTTIPDYWSSFAAEHGNRRVSDRDLLLAALRNLAGIAAVVAKLRLLASNPRPVENGHSSQNSSETIPDLVSLLEALLEGEVFVSQIWRQIHDAASTPARSKLLWKEFVSLVSSGRIIAAVAQGQTLSKYSTDVTDGWWLARGREYATWLSHNVSYFVRHLNDTDDSDDGWTAAAQLLAKSFGLGYLSQSVEVIIEDLALNTEENFDKLRRLLRHLQGHERKRFLDQAIRFVTRYFQLQDALGQDEAKTRVSVASAFIAGLVNGSKPLHDHLLYWLSDPVASSAEPLACRRAVLAVLSASDEQHIQTVMEANMKLFGEVLFVKHAPIMQQEVCAETLLLSAGAVHRSQPMFLFTLARSSVHMSGISNRLNSSSARARYLGMCVGIAVSKLVDKPVQRLTFDVEEVTTQQAKELMSLTEIQDTVGSSQNLAEFLQSRRSALVRPVHNLSKPSKETSKKSKAQAVVSRPSEAFEELVPTSGSRVIELLSDSDEDGLVPYAKPDSDPEDDEEDPTLVNRNKPKAPVYIRDLIAGLQDRENYDRHHLALTHAASLIRRKIGHGKEVSDHAYELGSILAGLGDHFELENFADLRLQALIALLISDPKQQAPWFARQVFDGDYSLSQRATLLSAMGLSARELAGHNDGDLLNPSVTSANAFPSKRLPERYHNIYTSAEQTHTIESTPVERVTRSLERDMVQPLAASAADAAAGPSALKVRTFSSRMNASKRTKTIPNTLAKMLAESFFFPLTGHWATHARAYGSVRNVHFQPMLLTTFLKTLALLLHASGPGTLSLPQLTAEFWDLLLSVRGPAGEHVAVLEAVLFALLTLLEVNEDQRRLAEEHARPLVETQEWAQMIFERTGGGDEEGDRVRMLAASVLIRTREVVEKYQRLLVGDMMQF